jgi:hypothetical protein
MQKGLIMYKNAFNCKKCPQKNDSDGCPCWWEMPWENQETGEIKTIKGCILSQEMGLPIIQVLVRSANVASEHASIVRNSVESGFGVLQELVRAHFAQIKQLKAPKEE